MTPILIPPHFWLLSDCWLLIFPSSFLFLPNIIILSSLFSFLCSWNLNTNNPQPSLASDASAFTVVAALAEAPATNSLRFNSENNWQVYIIINIIIFCVLFVWERCEWNVWYVYCVGGEEDWFGVWRRKHRVDGSNLTSCIRWWTPRVRVTHRSLLLSLSSSSFFFFFFFYIYPIPHQSSPSATATGSFQTHLMQERYTSIHNLHIFFFLFTIHSFIQELIAVVKRCVQITGESVGEVRAVSGMHQRKAEMARQADAFIALPGFSSSFSSFTLFLFFSKFSFLPLMWKYSQILLLLFNCFSNSNILN